MKKTNWSFVSLAIAVALLSACSNDYSADTTKGTAKEDAKTTSATKEDSSKVAKEDSSKATKSCALTFDDGPDPKDLKILEILKEHNVKASFFVNAQKLKQYPHIVKAMKTDGHIIGNHSYSHKNLQKLSISEQEQEILKGQQLLKENGIEARHYRPAYGAITAYAERKLKEMDLKVVMWNVDTYDYRAASSDVIVKRVENAKNIKHPVILMHSIQSKTVKALPAVIETLKEQGCRFVTI